MVIVALLGGAAFALFALGASSSLASAPSGPSAPEAIETQELEATISSQVSWGSAGGCVQNIQTNDFGNLIPNPTEATLGSFDALPHGSASTDGEGHSVWVGCVTTNTELASVEAAGTKDMESGSNTLALSNVGIGITNPTDLNGGTAGCEVTAGQSGEGACTLETGAAGQTLVSEAQEGTTELNWQYQLSLPANQPVGSYTGGEVTFTATAGEAKKGGGSPT
jgi:hypothetical protein